MTLGDCSRWLNRMTGGKPGESLCARMARSHGVDCRFCRFIGWLLSDPNHCRKEIE